MRQVAQRYTSDARAYERLFAPYLHSLSSAFVSRLPLGEAGRVLDLGCGVGTLLPDLAIAAPTAFVAGVDITHAMVQRASARYARVVMDAEVLGFTAASFDVVVSTFILQHVPDPRRAFKELHRVLRRGGILATITWRSPLPDYHALAVMNDLLDEYGAERIEALTRSVEVEAPATLTALLEGAGLTVLEQEVRDASYRMSVDSFLERMISLGLTRCRYETLADRRGFEHAARVRLESLPQEAFVEPSEIIETISRA